MNFTSLGGLDENGKNAHIFDFENNIIIVNFGSRYASKNEPGISYVIADLEYIQQKKDFIRAFFFTNILDAQLNVRALFQIRKILPNVPFYMSKMSLKLLINLNPGILELKNNINSNNDNHPINSDVNDNLTNKDNLANHKLGLIITFDDDDNCNPIEITPNLMVFAYQLPSSIPGNYGFVIEWQQQESVFIGTDYTNSSIKLWNKNFMSSFNKILVHNVGVFVADSFNCRSTVTNESIFQIMPHLEQVVGRSDINRFICPLYLKNISYLFELVNYCVTNNYKIAFITKNYYTVIDILIEDGLIDSEHKSVFTTDLTPHADQKLFILAIEKTNLLFPTLRKLFITRNNRFSSGKFEFNTNTDLYVPLYTADPGYELDHVRIVNHLIMNNVHVYQNKIANVIDCHPLAEQMLKTIGLLNPNFVIPINGLFVSMSYLSEITKKAFPTVNSLVLKNGTIVQFNQDQTKALRLPHRLPAHEIQFFGNALCTNSQDDKVVYQERNSIGHNGVIAICLLIDQVNWKILGKILVSGVGISMITINGLHVRDSIADEVQVLFNQQQPPNCSTSLLKKSIQNKCSDIVWNLLEKSPRLVTTIVTKKTSTAY